jgi:diguanylate cyclase (GGDEF)-like protein/PAS domain S-box-containing protein
VGTDDRGLVTEWNRAAEQMFDVRRAAALGRPVAEVTLPVRHRAAHMSAIGRFLGAASTTMACEPLEVVGMRSDGSEFPAEVSYAAVRTDAHIAFRAFVRDISARKALEAELVRRALTDQLTELPNRALLTDRLGHALSRLASAPSASALAVLMVDVDHIKVVNDSLGHAAGDEVLRIVAGRLVGAVGAADTVARFGGDSFAVVCEGLSPSQAMAIGNHLLVAAGGPARVQGRDVTVSVSVGVAVTTDPRREPGSLLSDADAAVYRAKDQGRGRTELFDDALRRRTNARLDLEAELRRAIDGDQLRLYFQPVVDVATERVSGCEALVRWAHPDRGLVPPAEFIPVAEETGLIGRVSSWVMGAACRQLATWRDDDGFDPGAGLPGAPPFHLAVNLSGHELGRRGLVGELAAFLDEADVDPSLLCVEITETVLVQDTPTVTAVLRQLHELGVRIAVDDFGTGYSSLLHLRRFPIDVLKLDRLFVAGLGRHEQDTAIVKATIDLAHGLGLQALAEGVERPEQLTMLAAMGCDQAQGFLWSPPVPPAQFLRHLDDRWATNPGSLPVGDAPGARSPRWGSPGPVGQPSAAGRLVGCLDATSSVDGELVPLREQPL